MYNVEWSPLVHTSQFSYVDCQIRFQRVSCYLLNIVLISYLSLAKDASTQTISKTIKTKIKRCHITPSENMLSMNNMEECRGSPLFQQVKNK